MADQRVHPRAILRPAPDRNRRARRPRGLAPAAATAATAVSTGVLVGVAFVALPWWDGDGALHWVPLALGLLLGLPHGAVDHLVPEWLRGRRLPRSRFGLLLAAYVLTAGMFFLALRVAPMPAALVFLVVSVAHFGAGDVAFTAARAGRVPRFAPPVVAGFGSPPVLLPLVAWPDQARPVLEGLAPGLTWLLLPTVRGALLVVVLGTVTWTVLTMLRAGDRRAAAEALGLAAVFALVPPLPAFGAYFGGWHAVRHLARMLSIDPRNLDDLDAGRLGPPLTRFIRQAALPTAAAITVLVVLWWGAGGAQGLVAAHLGLIAALTMPHVAVVALLDRTLQRAEAS